MMDYEAPMLTFDVFKQQKIVLLTIGCRVGLFDFCFAVMSQVMDFHNTSHQAKEIKATLVVFGTCWR